MPTFVTLGTDATLAANGALTISANAVALTTDTTGNYVASITSGNGISGSSASEGGTPTIAIDLLDSDDGTGLTSSNSGLEFAGTGNNELTLLQGCANNDVLAYNTTTEEWSCASVSGVGGVTGTGTNGYATYWTGTSSIAAEAQLNVSRGGTGVNGSSAGNGTLLIGNGSGYTLATLTDGTGITITEGSGTITIASTLGTSVDLTSEVTGVLPLANGGTNKNLTASNGAIVYSDADSFELSSVGTSGQALISGGAGAPTWFAPTAGSVLFAGTSGVLAQDNANFFWDDTNNRLGIGDATPDGVIDFDLSSTSTTAATAYGGYFTINDTGVVTTGSDTNYGQYIDVTRFGATGGTITTYGTYVNAAGTNAGSGTGITYGGLYNVFGGDTIKGVTANVGNNGGSPSSEISAFYASLGFDSNVTTAYGLNISSFGGDGTVTTGYGVYVADIAGTTDYAFYQAGSNDDNYFAGRLGIGDTTPAAPLTVGSGDAFQVNSSGAIAAATGIVSSGAITFSGLSAGGVVQAASGTGALSVGTIGASAITADSLDFTEFQDTLDLDAALTLNQSTNTWTQNYTGTTGTGLTYNANSLTTGSAFILNVENAPGLSESASALIYNLTFDPSDPDFTGYTGVEFNLTNNDTQNTGFGGATLLKLTNQETNLVAPGGMSVDALLHLDNADTTTLGTTLVDSAIKITNSGGAGFIDYLTTDSISIDATGAISGATGIVSSGTITFSGLSTGVVYNTSGTLASEAQLNVSRGGTGVNGSSAGNGTLLIGNGSGYTLATLTQGSGITITNGSGTITIASTLGTSVDLTSEVTGVLPVANGGTGTSTAFTTGSIVFAGASGVYTQDNANFFWNDSTNRLGIGTATPGSQVDIYGTSNALRLSYDGSNYGTLSAASNGNIAINSFQRDRVTGSGGLGRQRRRLHRL
ncbi:MAG: hypothetical protein WDN67_03255 [Candidatus Moraniibacteriota bacterium]